MKKIIFLFIFLLVLTGCGNDTDDVNLDDETEIDNIDNEIEEIDDSFGDILLDDLKKDIDSIWIS